MTITMRFKILAQDLSHPENFAVTHDGSFYVRDKDTFI